MDSRAQAKQTKLISKDSLLLDTLSCMYLHI